MKKIFPSMMLVGVALSVSLPVGAQDCNDKAKLANKNVKVTNVKVAQSGGLMTVGMRFNLDSLKLRTNQQIIFTPYLKTSDSDSTFMPEVVVNGRRQQIMYKRGRFDGKYTAKATIVKRENGEPQSIDYQASVPTQVKLRNYDILVHEDLCGCGNLKDGNDVPVHHYSQPYAPLVVPEVEAEKIRHLDKRAYIDFPVDKIVLYPEYRRNPAQLDSIINTINILKNDKNLEVQNINIHGYASPESPYSHNDYLAQNRAKTLTNYVRQQVQLPQSVFSVSSTPEDWEGLRNYLKESFIDNRDQILAIASDESLDPDVREKKIKTLYPKQYRYMLDNWYPALRHSDYHITYKVKPFDVAEAKEIIKTKPQQLSLNEMFMVAQTYDPSSKEFAEVMETAVRMYPTSEVANLNAACTRLNVGDPDGAKPYLDKAGDSAAAQKAREVYEELKK